MGNSNTKEARRQSSQQDSGSGTPISRVDPNVQDYTASRPSIRNQSGRRGSRPDFSSLLGIGTAEPDVSSLETRRENRQEREARKTEKERQARLKEREKSMKEEHVDGGYLVTQGVYVGAEDFNKGIVRQLMIERRLAPFWRGVNEFSESWAEHQIMAAARGMEIPPADEVPPELEYHLMKRPSPDQKQDKSTNQLTIPIGPRSESFQSDSGKNSPALSSVPNIFPSPMPSSSPNGNGNIFRARAKTLASLGSTSRNASDRDLSPREYKLPHDPFVNGQPIEVYLYKDGGECPVCFLYYPPYLNTTRCCEQPICSECFVQIKRPDPHPPEHTDPDPNAPPVSEEERQAQAEGLLVSEVATCPYCRVPEFGITYAAPPIRRGLTYSSGQQPYQIMSAMSSQTSVASSGKSPGPGRRRGTSLSANAPEVITTDKIRPDWANKLAAARAHAARRSAAASALHAAAYLMNDPSQRPPNPFSRRTMLRRSTLEGPERPTDSQFAMTFTTERHGSAGGDRGEGAHLFLAPPRGSSTRRSRIDDLEDMMMMEAIRLSLAAEEERRKKEEKDAKKKAKKEEKEHRKAEKAAKKTGLSRTYSNDGPSDAANMERSFSNSSSIVDDQSKGKSIEQQDDSTHSAADDLQELRHSPATSSMHQESTTSETLGIPIPSGSEPFRRSHLRQMSTASSASSSFQEPGSGTPQVNEPMFNFRSLAAMIGDDEPDKSENSSHVENADSPLGAGEASDKIGADGIDVTKTTDSVDVAKDTGDEPGSSLKNVVTVEQVTNEVSSQGK